MSDGRAVVVPPVALSGWDDEDDDDNFGGDRADDYDLQELIESEITLDSWVDALGVRLANVGLSVGDDEVCATPPQIAGPLQVGVRGLHGQLGNTLDRWYHLLR